MGRSTAGKALTALEKQGLAVRVPGGHDGPRRTPDRRHPAPATSSNDEDGPLSTNTPEPVDNNPTPDPAPSADPTPDSDNDETNPHHEGGTDTPDDERVPAPRTAPEQQAAPARSTTLPGGKRRLAPGALRQLVIAHLEAHPSESFTATGISRVIEKSSGTIANALVTLTKQGITEQMSEKPRTYRLADAAPSNE